MGEMYLPNHCPKFCQPLITNCLKLFFDKEMRIITTGIKNNGLFHKERKRKGKATCRR